MAQRKYDSTVARIAGNIIGHLLATTGNVREGESANYVYEPSETDVKVAVRTARAIVAETLRTEPDPTVLRCLSCGGICAEAKQ